MRACAALNGPSGTDVRRGAAVRRPSADVKAMLSNAQRKIQCATHNSMDAARRESRRDAARRESKRAASDVRQATHDACGATRTRNATRTGGEPMVITAEADESSLQAELVLPAACCRICPATRVRSVRSLHSPRLTHQRPDHTVYIVQTYEDSWCGDAFASRPCHRPAHSHTPSAPTLGTRRRLDLALRFRGLRWRSAEYTEYTRPCTGGHSRSRGTLAVHRAVHAPCGASCATYSRGGRGRRSWRRWSLTIHSSPHQRRTNERPHVPAASSRGH